MRSRRPSPSLWRREHLIEPLIPLAFFERACAHARLGWLPKVETIDEKIALGRQQHTDLTTAARLERAAWAMSRLSGGSELGVPARCRSLMMEIDRAGSSRELLSRLHLEVKAALAHRYATLIERADPVLDAHLLEVLVPARAEAERQVTWAKAVVGSARRGAGRKHVTELLEAGGRGPRLARGQWRWHPVDRVPAPLRAPRLDRNRIRAGALYSPHTDTPGTRSWVGEFFHHLSGSEMSTMELYGRSSYEHPDLPEEFHAEYARVTADEARHADLALGLCARFGRPYGSQAIDTSLYESQYEFAACPAGSEQELLWRLLLQGTLREGLIIEFFTLQAKKLRHLQFEDVGRVVQTIADEEVPHVEIALRWSRHLCGGDKERVRKQRDAAHAEYQAAIVAARRRYVEHFPDQAIAETEQFQTYARRTEKTFPFSLKTHVNRPLRKRAGFTEREIDQVVRWGYLHP